MSPDKSSALGAEQAQPKAPPIARRVWSLDRAALASLLLVLDGDPDQAAVAYEALRQRLIRFFISIRSAILTASRISASIVWQGASTRV